MGFELRGELVEIGSVGVRLVGAGAGRGIVGWSVRGLAHTDLDGLPTELSGAEPPAGNQHRNGVVRIDHLVAFTPDLERTTAALTAAGLDLRRVREEPTPGGAPRQAFFRMGEVILEVVQAPAGTRMGDDLDAPARLWGISFLVGDLEATAAFLGDRLGTPRDAVQPGRRIATLRKEAGLGPAIAFMTPGPGAT